MDQNRDLNLFERTLRSVWNAEPELRREFGNDRSAYLALRRAQARGQIVAGASPTLLEPLKRLWRESATS